MWCTNLDTLNELLMIFVLSPFLFPLFWLHNSSLSVCYVGWLFTALNFLCNLSSPSTTVFFFSPFPPSFPHCIFMLFHLLSLSLFHPSTLPLHTITPILHHCFLLPLPLSDIRLRVRAEYLEHESALRDGVSSDKRQPLERQFELFSRANSLLRARDLGSIVCDIKFTELDNLEAFWGDYLSGALLEALKGVFITDSLRMAAGTEGVRLLISVDQDDYEEGRRVLRVRRMMSPSNGGRTETHWAA